MTPPLPLLLLVEDNDDHAELFKRALQRADADCELERLRDGETAIERLFDSQARRRPDIVLLDLRLPRVDGLEVLRRVKESEELRVLPVVILSTSEAEVDLARAYHHHANAYLVKPPDPRELARLLRDLNSFWLSWNRRPESCSNH